MPDSSKPSRQCPLCLGFQIRPYHSDKRRDYYVCLGCRLVFVPPEHHLSTEEEKTEYDLHQNSPDDAGYRRFLGRLFEPLQQMLPPASHGLDFGCGPGPTLSVMFEAAGYQMNLYDRFYAPNAAVLEQRYSFVTATEVVEHLREPRQTLDCIWNCLHPGGLFGVMTKMVLNREAFARWHYKNDLTHICFFARVTFQWLAESRQAQLEFIGRDVVVLRKMA